MCISIRVTIFIAAARLNMRAIPDRNQIMLTATQIIQFYFQVLRLLTRWGD